MALKAPEVQPPPVEPVRQEPPAKPKPKPASQKELARRLFGAAEKRKKGAQSNAAKKNDSGKSNGAVKGAVAKPASDKTKKADDSAAKRFELDPEEYPTLVKYGRNLTVQAARGGIDAVVGRADEIGQLIDILNKRRSNNPVLVG
ncbi:MAG: hypothetical protein KC561_21845, partial [Myxococcales bacterium]|nr:hypothetical protein [Myxococcales bacterium]